MAWKWYARDGSIFDRVTGKRIYTDRISVFVGASSGTKQKVGDSRVQRILAQQRTDGYVYFSIGEKRYRVAIKEGKTMAYEDIKCTEGYFWCRAHLEERPLSERSVENPKYCNQCMKVIKDEQTMPGASMRATKTENGTPSEAVANPSTGWTPEGRKQITKEIVVNGKKRLQRFWVKE